MNRILIVDDEKSLRTTLAAFLEKEGHGVEAAADATSALERMEGGGFDLVVTDIVMPGMSGMELVQRIRAAAPGTQVIVMTGEPTVETAVLAVRAGAVDYLKKPINKQLLLLTVEKALAVKAEEEEKERHKDLLERLVGERTRDLQKTMENMVLLMSSVVEMRDPYTAGHQRRVGNLAADIGRTLGLHQDQVDILRIIGYIHDIGKIVIPAEILSKPGKLSPAEMEIIKVHSAQGYEILNRVELPWVIAETIYQHHERLDGSGYPRGIGGHHLTAEANILIVADVVEAMMSHRPYRPALGIGAALEEIERNAGRLYDPKVVEACVNLFRNRNYRIDEENIRVNFPMSLYSG
ncbi:HD-GYP domain-containing protein [Anaerotalea alkaliphila]|uniref:Stage 0 sporulation protein A homolog n=1 Tax=Anaerotalea alkaliphila TaxID=2662126 RepID=A0A7X5KLN4_9FIRM|nr:HD domain-containing phosphohydrolase [Anaerotalea alkaliphila]NDL67021.1 response regulator [Anaerotalea alkaliphila]